MKYLPLPLTQRPTCRWLVFDGIWWQFKWRKAEKSRPSLYMRALVLGVCRQKKIVGRALDYAFDFDFHFRCVLNQSIHLAWNLDTFATAASRSLVQSMFSICRRWWSSQLHPFNYPQSVKSKSTHTTFFANSTSNKIKYEIHVSLWLG